MSTPTKDEQLRSPHSREAPDSAADDAPETLTELGKVSDTQGGILGTKYDSGYGWQAY